MLEVIKCPEAEHDIEGADTRRLQLVDVQSQVLRLRLKRAMELAERVLVDVIDRRHLGAAALHLESVEPVPGTDVEYGLTAQVIWQSECGHARALPVQGHDSR